MPVLLDQFGNPINTDRLKREEAKPTVASIRSNRTSFQTAGMDPAKLARIIRSADEGNATAYLEMAEQLEEKDAHYLSILGTRKRAVARLEFTVEDADTTPEAKADGDLVRDLLARQELQAEVFDILDAIGKGYSVTEIIWRTDATSWTIDQLKHRDPRWFEFDRIDGETLRLIGENGQPEPLTPFKYIVHTQQAKSGLPIRGGVARPCSWMYLFKNFSIKDWIVFMEAYGQPVRVGKYGAGATEEDKRVLLQAIANIGSDFGAIIPSSMEIEFIESQQKTASADMFNGLIRLADEQMSKAVLGQTTTTDAAPNGVMGNANHGDVRSDICDADAVQLAASLTKQVAIPLVMLNRGVRKKYPTIRIGMEERVDTDKLSTVAARMIAVGAKISRKKMMEQLNLPEAESDDDVMVPMPTAAPQTMARDTRQLLARAAALPSHADAISKLAEEMSGEDEWKEILDPVMAAVDIALASSTSFDEFNDKLLELGAKLGAEDATKKISEAVMSARLAGNVGAKLK